MPPQAALAAGLFRATRKAPVAQLDRAPDYESGGQEFESLRARHYFEDLALYPKGSKVPKCCRFFS